MRATKVDLAQALADVQDHWTPRTVAGYNGDHVQVLKVQGEWVWHHHDRTDDLFIVLEGEITVQLRDGDQTLTKGQLLVVPAGMEHCVIAHEEAHLLVLEHLGDVPLGEEAHELTGPLTS